jgi:hypothetical protein
MRKPQVNEFYALKMGTQLEIQFSSDDPMGCNRCGFGGTQNEIGSLKAL